MIRFPLSTLLLAVGGLTPLAAQAAPPEEDAVLPAVTVKAKGYPSSGLSTPASVTVLQGADLQKGMPSDLSAALGQVPGLSFNGDGGLGLNPVLRGLKREQIVVMVDGIRIESLQPAGALAGMADPLLLERVEVVRGPVSVLYGSGGMGGVVDLGTTDPGRIRDGSLSGNLRLGAGSGDDRRQGAFQVASGNAFQGFVLGGSLQSFGDYDSPRGTVPWTGYRRQAGQLGYVVRPAEGQSLTLRLQRDEVLDAGFPGSLQPRPAGGTSMVHSPRTRRTLAALTYDAFLGGAEGPRLKVQAHRQEVDRTLNSLAEPLNVDVGLNDVSFRTRGLDARLEWGTGAWHWLGGASFSRMEASPDSRALGANGAWSFAAPYRNGRQDSLGGFLQGDWKGERAGLTLGGRWDRIEGTAESIRLSTGAYAPVTAQGLSLTRADQAFSGSLGFTWRLAQAAVPYLSISRAFRAPDLRERFQSGVRADGLTYQGNPQLRPEYSVSLETGLKGQRGAFSYQVGVFQTRIGDAVAGRTVSATQRVTENLGAVRLRGVDGQTAWAFPGANRVVLTGSWVVGDNLADHEPLYQVPPREWGLQVEHRPGKGWNGDLRLRWVERQDRVAAVFTKGRENPTAGFSTLEAGLGWRFDPLGRFSHEIRLQGRNLTHHAYVEHLTEGLPGQEPLAPGRQVQLNWSARF